MIQIPEIAILGHPNEGKSAVVSTLAEDDSVVVSPMPGETTVCRIFPVYIDGEEVLRFTDTPGFQSPRQLLKALQAIPEITDTGSIDRLKTFIDDPETAKQFPDERELLKPIIRGAGIIYVADGSRPVRAADRAEMEILRLTGKPRMAIINRKTADIDFSEDWKNAFRQHFNAIRFFNAHDARFQDRLALLDSLKYIDPDWEPILSRVIAAVTDEWHQRLHGTADDMIRLLKRCLTHKESATFSDARREKIEQERLFSVYTAAIQKIEKEELNRIRQRFRHQQYQPVLPQGSILKDALFDKRTWQVAGLTPGQVTATAAACGGAVGLAFDLATLGHSLGAFAAIGSIAGAGAAWLKGEKLVKTKVAGLPVGGYRMYIGPHKNVQFLFVLLDRAFVYVRHVASWAHGRRDYGDQKIMETEDRVKNWSSEDKKICQDYFSALQSDQHDQKNRLSRKLKELIDRKLLDMLA